MPLIWLATKAFPSPSPWHHLSLLSTAPQGDLSNLLWRQLVQIGTSIAWNTGYRRGKERERKQHFITALASSPKVQMKEQPPPSQTKRPSILPETCICILMRCDYFLLYTPSRSQSCGGYKSLSRMSRKGLVHASWIGKDTGRQN